MAGAGRKLNSQGQISKSSDTSGVFHISILDV
jgi:hypothetical protein